MKITVSYFLLIVLLLSCSAIRTKSKLKETNKSQILMVKDLIDTIFQKEVLLKRYLKFNKNDTIYLETDSILGIDKNWNNVAGNNKYEIFTTDTTDTTDKHLFKFLELKIHKSSVEMEVISESTGNIIIGEAKLKDGVWDLRKIKSGIR